MKLLINIAKIIVILLCIAVISFLIYNAWPTFASLYILAPLIAFILLFLAFLAASFDDNLNEVSYYEKTD